MARFLRERGMQKEASRISMKRVELRAKYGQVSLFDRFAYFVSKYTIGNGYKPYRSLVWAIGIIIVSAWLFNWGKFAIVTTSKDISLNEFNAFVYAIDTFLPIIDFGHAKNFQVVLQDKQLFLSQIVRTYYWFHVAFGWILSTIAIIGFSGIIRKD
jgi:hypothetical protein